LGAILTSGATRSKREGRRSGLRICLISVVALPPSIDVPRTIPIGLTNAALHRPTRSAAVPCAPSAVGKAPCGNCALPAFSASSWYRAEGCRRPNVPKPILGAFGSGASGSSIIRTRLFVPLFHRRRPIGRLMFLATTSHCGPRMFGPSIPAMMEPNSCFPAWGQNLLRGPDGTPLPAALVRRTERRDTPALNV
jgi:hypothetical protein